MRHVEQRGDSDCFVAALASILDLDYKEVPQEIACFDGQWNAAQRFVQSRGLILWSLGLWGDDEPKLMFGSEQIEYHLFPFGYWLASVRSPRTGNGHMVVMKSSHVAWDPHPRRDMGHRGFLEALFFNLFDRPER